MRNSVRRLSETKIMSLLAESNISSNKVVSCLLKIGKKFGREVIGRGMVQQQSIKKL